MREYWTIHTKWYWKRYFELSETANTYKEAWMQVEEEHFEKFHFNKFDEYVTFRVEKSKRINLKKPKIASNQTSLFPEYDKK